MRQRLLFIFVFLLATSAYAQTDSSHLRISLLTCGVGEEIWEVFGHTALRVTDSINGTDDVYNYGTFNGFEEGFELKFMQGKLLYYVSYYPYTAFVREYMEANRRIEEQVLILDGRKKESIYEFLRWNSSEGNKYYQYDFFYDNCATRIRDVFPKTFGNAFTFGKTIPSDSKVSFRNIINQYLYRNHFERFGINILLGSKIDKIMSNEDIMFLPDYLRDGIGNATVKGQQVAARPVTILEGAPLPRAPFNWVLLGTIIVAILTIGGLFIPSWHRLREFMSGLLLFLTGIIGVIIIVMWLGTDHQACRANWSLLWALPTNILIAFASKRNKDKYAIIGIVLIVVSLFLHILRVQELPLFELWPILLSLLAIYGTVYRKNKLKLY